MNWKRSKTRSREHNSNPNRSMVSSLRIAWLMIVENDIISHFFAAFCSPTNTTDSRIKVEYSRTRNSRLELCTSRSRWAARQSEGAQCALRGAASSASWACCSPGARARSSRLRAARRQMCRRSCRRSGRWRPLRSLLRAAFTFIQVFHVKYTGVVQLNLFSDLVT